MIESCPKKRMILGITLQGILTVLVLIVESHWTESNKRIKKQNFVVEQNSTCWEKEKYEVIKDCEPCSAFELQSKHIGVLHSHPLQRGTKVCKAAFWRFEGLMFIGSIGSTFCVVLRRGFKQAYASKSSEAAGQLCLNLENMDSLFINVYQDTDTSFSVNVETAIILTIYGLGNRKNLQLFMNQVKERPDEPLLSGGLYKC
ncbi:hypothetical protein NQ318_001338 [Aromia moschata]|uniref:Uncharacterized protein n=1 Tax=Aromia moschata TaxID=1265417 RepID=A0AAV8ZGT4_9CUCU|nr:hypothetical protein NQ318_001338 [Aromia moschata]